MIGLISFILITNKQIFNSQDINSQPIKVGGVVTNIVPNNDFLTYKGYSVGTSTRYVLEVKQADIVAYKMGTSVSIKKPPTHKEIGICLLLAVLTMILIPLYYKITTI